MTFNKKLNEKIRRSNSETLKYCTSINQRGCMKYRKYNKNWLLHKESYTFVLVAFCLCTKNPKSVKKSRFPFSRLCSANQATTLPVKSFVHLVLSWKSTWFSALKFLKFSIMLSVDIYSRDMWGKSYFLTTCVSGDSRIGWHLYNLSFQEIN